jgi:hypothetical protein
VAAMIIERRSSAGRAAARVAPRVFVGTLTPGMVHE